MGFVLAWFISHRPSVHVCIYTCGVSYISRYCICNLIYSAYLSSWAWQGRGRGQGELLLSGIYFVGGKDLCLCRREFLGCFGWFGSQIPFLVRSIGFIFSMGPALARSVLLSEASRSTP